MGDFRLEITGTGAHGCDRASKDGEGVKRCESETCPDCVCDRFVQSFREKFAMRSAVFTHWPGEPSQVSDVYNPANGQARRRGAFV